MFGHSSFEELYSACCPSSRLDDITIPVLGLNAADDPFTPPHGRQPAIHVCIINLKPVRLNVHSV